jgi:predicted NACHT family NTPase
MSYIEEEPPGDLGISDEIGDFFDGQMERDDSFDEFTPGLLIEHIRRRMLIHNSNYNILIIGAPGTGKSWSAIRLASTIYPGFSKDPIIVFDVESFLQKIKEGAIKKGGCIVFDEVGVGVNKRLWFTVVNRAANMTFQTMRSRNFTSIFTTPFPDYVDNDTRKLFQITFRYFASKKNRRIFSAYKNIYNEMRQKYFYQKMSFSLKGSHITLAKVVFRKPPAGLIRKYEAMKQEFQDKLYDKVFKEVTHATQTPQEKWIAEVKRIQNIVEPQLEDHYLVDKTIKGEKKKIVDKNLIKADTGANNKVVEAVTTLLNRKYGLENYEI